jgi:hypothetical protein
MADHPNTWARILKMAHTRFPGNEPAAQAFARFTYDAKETVAYATTMDADDEERAILDAARGVAEVRGNLCAELREEASVSASATAGRYARAVERPAHAEVLHANGSLRWATVAEVLDEVDDDE